MMIILSTSPWGSLLGVGVPSVGVLSVGAPSVGVPSCSAYE